MTHRLALLLLLAGLPTVGARADALRFETAERIVAVSDVHGAYDELVHLLVQADILDERAAWTGGRAHLVVVGDIVDRGADSRRVLDLLMALEKEASRAGGRVHVLLGNHEVMNLVGDLRYVHPGELAAFSAEERQPDREAAEERLMAGHGLDRDEARKAILERCPPGYFGHRAAFGPDGRYGRWLLERPILAVINDFAFVHGGLAPVLLDLPADDVNRIAREQLAALLRAQSVLYRAGVLAPEMSWATQRAIAKSLATQEAVSVVSSAAARNRMAAARALHTLRTEGLAFRADGPLWYRGTSLTPAREEEAVARRVLEHLGAQRAVIGHTPNHTFRITTRLGGRIIRLDTGMQAEAYHGRPAAMVAGPSGVFALYDEGEIESLPLAEEPVAMSASEILRGLLQGPITAIVAVGSGRTSPKQVTISLQADEIQAIFKTDLVNLTDVSGELHDHLARREVAADRIDRLLGLGLVPPTVIREIGGEQGSLQLWIADAISEDARRSEGILSPDPDRFQRLLDRSRVFDAIIGNEHRDETNVLVTISDWRVHLIDHGAAFGRHRTIPDDLVLDSELRGLLAALDAETIRGAVGDLLTDEEIAALLARRDETLAVAARPAA